MATLLGGLAAAGAITAINPYFRTKVKEAAQSEWKKLQWNPLAKQSPAAMTQGNERSPTSKMSPQLEAQDRTRIIAQPNTVWPLMTPARDQTRQEMANQAQNMRVNKLAQTHGPGVIV